MVLNLNLLFLDQIVATFSSGTVKAKVSFDYKVEIGNIYHFLNFYKISNYLLGFRYCPYGQRRR